MKNRTVFALFQILLFSFVAAGLGFLTACALAALPVLAGAPGPETPQRFMMFVLYGAVPCGSLGTVLGVVAWLLIPRAQRVLEHVWPRVQATATVISPVTPAFAARFPTPVRPPLLAGAVVGTLLSFLNVPGYLALGAVGGGLLGVAFVGAGTVAGVFLGWCRYHTVDRVGRA